MSFGYQVLGFGSYRSRNPPDEFIGGARGLFGGGFQGGVGGSNAVEYLVIANNGNASDFGDLVRTHEVGACGTNGSRVIFAGGGTGALNGGLNTIQYFTAANTGNSTDFGDLVRGGFMLGSNCGDGTRSVFMGVTNYGGATEPTTDEIQYITVATTGNSTDFGDCVSVGARVSTGNGWRGVGISGTNGIEFITVATTGDSQDFGDLVNSRSGGNYQASSDGIRAVVAGGSGSSTDSIDFFAVATLGDSTDFGDLTSAASKPSCSSNGTSMMFNRGSAYDQIIVQTLGNATSRGNTHTSCDRRCSASGS